MERGGGLKERGLINFLSLERGGGGIRGKGIILRGGLIEDLR